MALDFTALNKITYRGYETDEERQQKDALTDKGYSIVENADNPFLQAVEPRSSAAWTTTSGAPEPPAERKPEPFMSASGRDYKALYRAAHDFHQRHNPPVVNLEYWSTHTPGEDNTPEEELEYWRSAAEDVSSTVQAYHNDSFLSGLLGAVYDELGREYSTLRDNA